MHNDRKKNAKQNVCPAALELPPPDFRDPVIEAYKKDVDRTLLRENLRLTVEQRIEKAESFHQAVEGWREAGRKARTEAAESRAP